MNKKAIGMGLTLAALAGTLGCAGTNAVSAVSRRTSTADFKYVERSYEGRVIIKGTEKGTETWADVRMNYSKFADGSEECELWLPPIMVTDDKTYTIMIFDSGCNGIADTVTIYETDSCQSTEKVYTRKQLEDTIYLGFFDNLALQGISVLTPENEVKAKATQKALDEVLKNYQKQEKVGK